jgi:tetratricopeptide (TPR) repeat protein
MRNQTEREKTTGNKLNRKRGYLRLPALVSCFFAVILFSSQASSESPSASVEPSIQTMDIEELDQRGDWLLRDKKYEEAIGAWKQALEKDPRHVDTLLRTGIALSLLEKYQQAHATLSQALEIEPENPKVLYNLGLLFMRQNQDDKALEYLERTLTIVDWYPEANYHIGLIYERKGLKEKALEFYIKEVNNVAASAKTWQRLFMLKKQLAQQSESAANRNRFSAKTAILIPGLLVATICVLALRKLSTG